MNLRIPSTILLALLFLFIALEGNDPVYRWPLSINNGYSSAFQEFRASHFHGGMDLRTYQKTGYPVHAISSGVIVTIRCVRRGSGKGLYLKHDDGNMSVYFHLDRFAGEIETQSRKVSNTKGTKYYGNYHPNPPIRVKAGERIGYSGETGSGLPHLHLEIRDPQGYAMNPFPLLRLPARDNHNPRMLRLLLRPVAGAMINGTGEQVEMELVKKRAGQYETASPVVTTGVLDMVLNARDVADTGKYVGPYRVSAWVGDQPVYHIVFDRFRWEDNNQLGFVYDMEHSRSGSYYFNLFSQTGFELEKTGCTAEQMSEILKAGEHRVRVEIEDNYGNASQLNFRLIRVPIPHISGGKVIFENDSLRVGFDHFEVAGADGANLRILSQSGNRLYTGSLDLSGGLPTKDLVLEGVGAEGQWLEVELFRSGVTFWRHLVALPSASGLQYVAPRPRVYINRDTLRISFPSLFTREDLSLQIQQNEDPVIIERHQGSAVPLFITRPNHLPRPLRCLLIRRTDQQVEEIARFDLPVIHLRPGTAQRFQQGMFHAEFAVNSVREPRTLAYSEKQHPGDLPLLSPQVSLYPYHFPFLDRVIYAFVTSVDNPRQAGIFKFDPARKRWRYVFTTYDSGSSRFSTRVISSGTFALMRDTRPPRIRLAGFNSRYVRSLKTIVLSIVDRGKGIHDASLRVRLNNTPLDCEYDPDRNHVKLENISGLVRTGINHLVAQVEDNGGNVTRQSFSIRLK